MQYTEKNTPHPEGPRAQRRKHLKKRCKRLRLVRNKLILGNDVLCNDMKRQGKKVRKMLQDGVINPYLIMRATGVTR